MVGLGLLKPDPVTARHDTPKRLKALCLKCSRFERRERPYFSEVSSLFPLHTNISIILHDSKWIVC